MSQDAAAATAASSSRPEHLPAGYNYSIWQVIAASSAGTVIEWYDFYIFGALAAVVAPLFYPQGNDVIALDVLRDGQTLKIAVAMTERHDPFSSLQSADPRQNVVPRLGILGVDLDQRIATMLPVLRVKSGVVVASTAARGIDAREGGLAAGDVVYAVNKNKTSDSVFEDQ